jgi:hypothetical protein
MRQQALMFANLEEADFGGDDLEVEEKAADAVADVGEVVRDLEGMTKSAKLRQIAKDSPELLGLLNELRKTMEAIREKAAPPPAPVSGGAATGVSLLSVQHHLLLHYCVTLVFYLLMKAEGRVVRGHPVIDRLITIRATLERVRPLRAKIQHALDRIVRQQVSLPPFVTTADSVRSLLLRIRSPSNPPWRTPSRTMITILLSSDRMPRPPPTVSMCRHGIGWSSTTAIRPRPVRRNWRINTSRNCTGRS